MLDQWWKDAVIYEIFPRSFNDTNGDGIGDIKGIIEKLDYLKNLGIDTLWICPVYPSHNNDSGYDVDDYYDIWDELGTMSDMESLIYELHIRDMKLIMELIANHSSDTHQWFLESRKSKDNPYRDYYIWKKGRGKLPPNNWYSLRANGTCWTYDEKTDEYYFHIYTKHQPDLNWKNIKVREEIYDIMRFWFKKGVDGFRMDVINKIAKQKGMPDILNENGTISQLVSAEKYFENIEHVHYYLKEMRKQVLSEYSGKLLLGQTAGVTPEQAYLYTNDNRAELDLFLQFEHVDLDRGPNKTKLIFNLVKFKRSIAKWQTALNGKLWNTIFFGSHDSQRPVSHFGNDKKYRKESAKMLATIQLLLKGTPIIYQGEEIGMTNVKFDDINDYRDHRTFEIYKDRYIKGKEKYEIVMETIKGLCRDSARTPMQWDNSENAGFTKGVSWIKPNINYKEINVEDAVNDKQSIYYYYKELIGFRKSHEIVKYGTFKLVLENDYKIFAYLREYNNQKMLVISNFSEYENSVSSVELEKFYGKECIIHNYNYIFKDVNRIRLRPFEVKVFLV